MRFSKGYVKTLKETPKEAEVISHKLLLRAGMIKKLASGVYSFLPLGLRTLKKIETIVREEMNRAGAIELFLPVLQPAELWQESGRWTAMGPEMFRLKDRNERDFSLGPTHEEVIVDIVRNDISSYKSLPLHLYQIQTKFRDERRPRFGLMRGREFLMKDSYSFHRDLQSLEEEFQKMYNTYSRIFERCGLKFRAVEADSGAIGGTGSKEFHVLAESGEDEILYCDACDYASNVEAAVSAFENPTEALLAPELVSTPGKTTIEDLAVFLGIPESQTLKSMLYRDMVTDEIWMVLIRGDFAVNEIKLKNALGTLGVALLTDTEIADAGLAKGYIGPYDLAAANIKILADKSVINLVNAVAGGNRVDYHYKNVNYGRDYSALRIDDIRLVKTGDSCPRCGAPLMSARGIETGHIFKLKDKYTKPMNATFLDEKGEAQTIIMGTYGIGVSRTMAAAIEQHNDADGIIWPSVIAPYVVDVIPANVSDPVQAALAEELYGALNDAGVDTAMDDREERPGFKFKDADLIGFPFKVIAGKKAAQGVVELKIRKTGETLELDKKDVVAKIQELRKIY
ncbi:MAG: proline--tRNA ligase [Fusobacteriaceae bacterium]|jgi:prolyl-tRNA synthetase|nr:proline--tRNA ligase [Fusobacteriaceae bacterium]